ncbi:MAG TPA: DMT family transporter, partial [Ktedonobacterales bacterium]|nr:DMT family transporter [Ktedonobacterales bacterium]
AFRRELIQGWQRYWRLCIAVSLVNILVPYMLISWGETRISSGTASILNAATPLFTVLLAHIWIGDGRESLTVRRVAGILVGFVGVGVLIGPTALLLTGNQAGDLWGEAAVLVAAAAYGVGGLLSRGFAGSARLVAPLLTQLPALLSSLVVASFWDPPTHLPSLKVIGAIAALGALGTAVAYLLYFWLINHVGATRTSLVTYLLPCTALIWGVLLLHEQVSWNALVGLVLVLLGTMTTNGTLTGLFSRLTGRRPQTSLASCGTAAVAAHDDC